ncbi:MAG TPA: HAMP domain-containing sensor histidine kinase [Solirubrobacteraceae bacterium]|nr:HAMP domain-containing sensor histidine kinase [Solirubrobacteraceae bacterium]
MHGARERLAEVGLRWRLAGWIALVVLVCTGVAFVAVYRGTGTQVRGQIDSELTGDAGDFSHNLALARARTPAQVLQAANRYVRSQPFTASSTLLFAVVPNAGTSTNRPELLQGGPRDDGESATVQAQENRLATKLLTVREGYATLALPDVGNLRVLERAIRLPGTVRAGARVLIGVGEPLAPVARAQRGVAHAFVLAGILALAAALLGAYVIGTRVSRPLRRMAALAARVDAGDLHPRIEPSGGQGAEVRVLADAFNHMLDRLTAAFAGQRAFIADASHELRTPLTVIGGQLELLAAQDDPPIEEVRRVERLVQGEIARMARLVDDLLLLAKSEQGQFLRIEPIDLAPFVEEIWHAATLRGDRSFELDIVPAGNLLADPDRLAQALRNLLANAIEHTATPDGLVRLRVQAVANARVRFLVEDDGPGIPADQRERVFDRFHRTDAARDRASGGAGLGLAIVRAIAHAHGGRVDAGMAAAGGARIELELPRFTVKDAAPTAAHLLAALPHGRQ